MKLISCYVENYGAISRKEYKFDENPTCFSSDNGTGKTTLASFIKAMFYGLSSFKANSKNFDDRQRFYPFAGGKFGGNLTFSLGEDVYRIERFFDKKSSVRDETKIYKNGRAFDGFGENIGKAVFGLDESAFVRTAFLTSEEVEINADGDLGAKLNGDFYDGDGNNLAVALKSLSERRKNIKADRGRGGLLDREKDLRQTLSDEIAGLKEIERSLQIKYEERAALEREISELNKKLNEANEARLAEEKWAAYDRYESDLREKREKIAELGNLPSSEILQDLDDKCAEIRKNRNLMESFALGTYRKNCSPELIQKFSALDEAKLYHITGLIQKYNRGGGEAAPPLKRSRSYFVAALIALLFAVSGIVACFFNLIAGIVLIAVGLSALAIDGFLYLKNRLDGAQTAHIRGLTPDIEREIRNFLEPYGYNSLNIIDGWSAFSADLANYRSQCEILKEIDERCAEYKDRNEKLEKEISAVLDEYKLPKTGDICGAIDELMHKRTILDVLVGEEQALSARAEKYRADSGLSERGAGFEEPDGLFEEMETKRKRLGVLDRLIAEDEERAELIPYKTGELGEADERLEKLKDGYELILLTEKYLKAADANLKEKYVAPVKERFDFYAEKISGVLGGKMRMDEDFSLTFESGGEIRSGKHLSAGQRCVCGLCLRLALIDNMYGEEKPFLIMDDPFVNLDCENFKGVLNVLKSLSGEIQIIYFTCHKSREI